MTFQLIKLIQKQANKSLPNFIKINQIKMPWPFKMLTGSDKL